MATLEQVLAQTVNRPGAKVISAADVAKRLQSFSGNTSEASSLGTMPIIGIRPDMVSGSKQMIGGVERDVFVVPVLVFDTTANKAIWKTPSMSALIRTSVDAPFAGSIMAAETFVSDAAVLQAIHAHVGNGDESAADLPAKHIRVEVKTLEREYDGIKRNIKYHGLYRVG